jgi:hypothetical protein
LIAGAYVQAIAGMRAQVAIVESIAKPYFSAGKEILVLPMRIIREYD